jgi:hypothetical protein
MGVIGSNYSSVATGLPMVAGPTPTRTSPQGIASRVIAPQHIAGRRHRRGVAGGDVARGHDRDQRAAGGVDHPPGVGGARPAPSRPGPSGRHPGRAAEPGPRRAVRGRARGPAAAPPPGRSGNGTTASDDDRGGVAAAVQRHPARRRPAVVGTPSVERPPVRRPSAEPPEARPERRPVRPPRPRPDRPEPGSPPWSWRRNGHKPTPTSGPGHRPTLAPASPGRRTRHQVEWRVALPRPLPPRPGCGPR